ncbi:MAG: hypothetical protein OXK76_10155 [Gammaproteobacteria bacterium]|nr:hypothetical protein [Gammaproteobacteria bacterium]
MNDGNGRFVPGGDATNIDNERATFSMAAGDYDLDGDLDLFFAHWGTGYGLGKDDQITAVDVVWPGPGGHASRVEGLSVDNKVAIRHP